MSPVSLFPVFHTYIPSSPSIVSMFPIRRPPTPVSTSLSHVPSFSRSLVLCSHSHVSRSLSSPLLAMLIKSNQKSNTTYQNSLIKCNKHSNNQRPLTKTLQIYVCMHDHRTYYPESPRTDIQTLN